MFYKKYKFNDIPMGKNIFITSDNQKLYYYDGQLKIYIKNIVNVPQTNKIINMTTSTIQSDDLTIVSLFVNIDNAILRKCITNPVSLTERYKVLLVAKQCYKELYIQYNFNTFTKLLESARNTNKHLLLNKNIKIYENNLEWMIYRERNKLEYYLHSQPLLKFGEYFIDISNGQLLTQKAVCKENVGFRGGILVNDSDENWICDFINLVKTSNEIEIRKEGYLKTNATLIFCDRLTCNKWKTRITLGGNDYKYIIIDNNNSHKNVTYNDIKQAKFVIVNINYISGYKYKKIWSEYVHGKDTNLKVMHNEYIDNECNILKYTCPIFSFFYWNRIIIDDKISHNMSTNKNLQEIIFNHSGYYRWIQLNKLPLTHTETMLFVRYLIGCKNTSLLMYDINNNIAYFDNIIRLNTAPTLCTKTIEYNIRELLIRVNMSSFEKKVYNFCIENSCDKNNKEFTKILIDCINQLSVNWLPYNDIIKNIKKNATKEITKLTSRLCKSNTENKTINREIDIQKNKLLLSNEIDENCKICCDSNELHDIVILECGHYFCINCVLNIIKYSGLCPYCRENVNIHMMYHIKNKKEMFGSKLQSLIDCINCDINIDVRKYLILCKYTNVLKYISHGLKINNISNIQLIGSSQGKINKLNIFNNKNNGIMLMAFDDINMINDTKNVSDIIFYDNPYTDNIFDKKKLHDLDIYSKSRQTQIHYMAYNNTMETRVIKVEN